MRAELASLGWRLQGLGALPHPALWGPPYRAGVLGLVALLAAAGVMGLMATLLGAPAEPISPPHAAKQADAARQAAPADLTPEALAALQARQRTLAQAVAEQQQRWPQTRWTQVLQDIQRIARQHGVVLAEFKPLTALNHDHHTALPVHLKLQAPHAALMHFLRDLAQLAQPVVLTDLNLQAHREGLTVEGKLLVLRLLRPPSPRSAPGHEASKPTQTTSPQTTSPPTAGSGRSPNPLSIPLPRLWPEVPIDTAEPGVNPFDMARLHAALRQQHPSTEPAWLLAQRGRSPQWLEQFALEDLQWVGQLRQQGQPVALIKVAQRIHMVRVGQYLGKHQGRVLSIEEQAMTVQEVFQDESGVWQQRRVVLNMVSAS